MRTVAMMPRGMVLRSLGNQRVTCSECLMSSQVTMLLEICNFGQSFSTRKYKKTHLHHYRSSRKKLKTQEEKSVPQEK
jgi:hypothetical protein